MISAKVVGEVGYVNFATPLSSLPREKQILAVGQLVLTSYEDYEYGPISQALERRRDDPSALVREHVLWALAQSGAASLRH